MKKILYEAIIIFVVIINIILGIKVYNNTNINGDNNLFSENNINVEDEVEMNNKSVESLETEVRLDIALINQLPELYNGCEVTSLTMLLNYKGINVDKITLANEMPVDNTPLIRNNNGEISSWGNPNKGFVGEVSSYGGIGYAINPEPLIPLASQYYDGEVVNLTGESIDNIKRSIMQGNPVLVWVTADFSRPSRMQSWLDSDGNEVEGTFETHTVLLTGYDESNFYYNDPLSQYKDASISIENFEIVWNDMGRKALSVK